MPVAASAGRSRALPATATDSTHAAAASSTYESGASGPPTLPSRCCAGSATALAAATCDTATLTTSAKPTTSSAATALASAALAATALAPATCPADAGRCRC